MEHTKDGVPELSERYLEPTEFFDWDNPKVKSFAEKCVEHAETNVEKSVCLFYAVRDSIMYDPYRVSLDRHVYHASNLLTVGAGFCLPKANLLIASARAVGIPAGIGLSDVVNHLCSEGLRKKMGGNKVFHHHGYAVLYIEGKWVKAAPAFNIKLCNRFGVTPTEFDGQNHALFQEYDNLDRRHMEYLVDHGIWSDFPFARVVNDFSAVYPSSLFSKRRGPISTRIFEGEEGTSSNLQTLQKSL